MLERVPAAVGRMLAGVRPGLQSVISAQPPLVSLPSTLRLTSPSFDDGGALPARVTADGPGLSPALAWDGVPAGTRELLLLVEDADAPTPRPLVHLIVHGIAPEAGGVDEGALTDGAVAAATGRNSYLRHGWLPPDPPPGHGLHRYIFQLFALDAPAALSVGAGRNAVIDALKAHGVARGRLIGTYERG